MILCLQALTDGTGLARGFVYCMLATRIHLSNSSVTFGKECQECAVRGCVMRKGKGHGSHTRGGVPTCRERDGPVFGRVSV